MLEEQASWVLESILPDQKGKRPKEQKEIMWEAAGGGSWGVAVKVRLGRRKSSIKASLLERCGAASPAPTPSQSITSAKNASSRSCFVLCSRFRLEESAENMSRASSATHQRSLTLTEELEKLEQSITLTLQGI